MQEDFQVVRFFVFMIFEISTIVYILPKVISIIDRADRRRGVKRMIRDLKMVGIRFYYNTDANRDVMAITTAEAFQAGLDLHKERVADGEAKVWDKVVVHALPTFTFASSEETLRPVHTGVQQYLERMIDAIVLDITKHDRVGLSKREYEDVLKTILIRDRRLFVPYSNAGIMDVSKQFLLYGMPTLMEA